MIYGYLVFTAHNHKYRGTKEEEEKKQKKKTIFFFFRFCVTLTFVCVTFYIFLTNKYIYIYIYFIFLVTLFHSSRMASPPPTTNVTNTTSTNNNNNNNNNNNHNIYVTKRITNRTCSSHNSSTCSSSTTTGSNNKNRKNQQQQYQQYPLCICSVRKMEHLFYLVICIGVLVVQYYTYHYFYVSTSDHSLSYRTTSNIPTTTTTLNNNNNSTSNNSTKCAILFWGLPRAFEQLVLPSIKVNILLPNLPYHCDYYIHYYNVSTEEKGRSGNGGSINSTAIYSIKNEILNLYHEQQQQQQFGEGTTSSELLSVPPMIEFVSDTDESFWFKYSKLIHKIRTTKDNTTQNNYYYFPYKAVTYTHPTTTDNIIKMWHSIQSVWECMEQYNINHHTQNHQNNNLHQKYQQIAMFRSDVLYVTPIDIFENPMTKEKIVYTTTTNITPTKDDTVVDKNSIITTMKMTTTTTSNIRPFVVIPDFGNHPVSDRIIYGPYDAISIWAKERFQRLEDHVQYIFEKERGFGLHSERFIYYTILPVIRNISIPRTIPAPSPNLSFSSLSSITTTDTTNNHHHNNTIEFIQHPTLCFLRARSDNTIWISDCDGSAANPKIMEQYDHDGKHNTNNMNNNNNNNKKRIKNRNRDLQLQYHIEQMIGYKCQSNIIMLRRNVKSLNCSFS